MIEGVGYDPHKFSRERDEFLGLKQRIEARVKAASFKIMQNPNLTLEDHQELEKIDKQKAELMKQLGDGTNPMHSHEQRVEILNQVDILVSQMEQIVFKI